MNKGNAYFFQMSACFDGKPAEKMSLWIKPCNAQGGMIELTAHLIAG